MRFKPTLYLHVERVYDDKTRTYKTLTSYKPLDTTPKYVVDDLETLLAAGLDPKECPTLKMDNFTSINHITQTFNNQ